MQCPNCETENREDAKFCDECGFPLGNANAHSAGASVASAAFPTESLGSSPGPEIDFQPEVDQLPNRRQDQLAGDFNEALPQEEDESSAQAPDEEVEPDEPDNAAGDRDDADFATQAIDDWDSSETRAFSQMMEPEDEDPFVGFSTQVEDDFDSVSDAARTSSLYAEFEQQSNPDHTMQMPRVNREAGSGSRDFRISSTGAKRTPKAALIVIAVAALAVVVAIVTFAFGLWGGVAVPDVTGMTESDARSVLEENGFSVRSTQVKSDDTEGLVLIMDPSGGSRAAEGSEIIIHIATARFIPDIVGKGYDEASRLLGEAGYENVRYEKVKSADEENVVMSVNPEVGTRAKSSMEVVVEVSEAYRVPDISGLDVTAAQEAITNGGLVPQVVYVDTQDYPEGTILGTSPEANTKVSEGDYVTINVARARGAELVALTQQMFSSGGTATIGGTDFAVDSVDSVEYIGDDTVSFKITGRPFATLMGETVYGTTQSVEGQVTWSESNEVLSIS